MSSQAQITANRANTQLSTGPITEEGKAVSSKNNFRHGSTGAFAILPWEKHKSLSDLVKLRAEKRKAEIGFVSQQRQTEDHARKQAVEKRKQEIHKWKVLQAEAEVDHRIMLNVNLQTPENRITVGPQHIIAAEKAA